MTRFRLAHQRWERGRSRRPVTRTRLETSIQHRCWHSTCGGSPAVHGGRGCHFGDIDNSVHAVDAATGDEQWRFDADASVTSSLTVVDGTAFLGSSDSVYALDAATGTERWRSDSGMGSLASPTVVNGTVYLGSNDSNVYALDGGTGQQAWVFTEPADGLQSSPAVVDGTVYIGSRNFDDQDDPVGNLYAIDAATGQEEWRFGTQSPITTSAPTVADNTVYVGDLETVYAVDAVTGDGDWVFRHDGIGSPSPTVHNRTVYVQSNELYALDAVTGQLEWAVDSGIGSFSATVVEDPATGDSVCSRIRLGSLNHHDSWAFADQSIERVGDTDDTGNGVTDTDDTETAEQSDGDDDADDADDDGPGFGVVGAVAALGGAGYLLGLSDDDTESG